MLLQLKTDGAELLAGAYIVLLIKLFRPKSERYVHVNGQACKNCGVVLSTQHDQ